MSVDTSWNIESYRTAYESEEHWELKREFMEAHKDRIPEARLICLAQVFVNIELLGCRYPDPVMKQVAVLARDVGKAYKESKKTKLQRTFVKASDAAGARLKGTTTSSLIEAASTYGTASPMSLEGSNPMSMTQGGGNPMSSMNTGAGNFMSSMNAEGGSSMSSMNTGSGNFKSSMNLGANNPMSYMNTGGSNPMNRGCNPMSSTNTGIANPTGSANTMNQGSSNASSLLGRPPSTLASKLAALKKPVAFVTAGTSNPLVENNSSSSDTTKTPNPNTPMLGGQNSNNNKNSSSLLGSPPQYNNSGYMFRGQSVNDSSTFRGSNANPSVFGGLSANPNMFGGSNPSSSLTGGSNSSATTYGGSNNNPSMTGGIKSSLYGGLINSTPSDNTGGSNINSSLLGGSNTNSSMLGGSNTNRPMLGGGSSTNNSMLGGSNTMLGGSNSMLGGSNSGTSLLGSGPNTSTSCLFPGGPPSPPTTIITAPPNKKKKSKADKNKDKPITEMFIKFIGGNRNTGGTPEATNKSAMTPPQKANASEVEGHPSVPSSSSSGFSSASSNFSSSKMSSQMSSSSSSSFKNPGPSSSSAFSSSSFSSSSSSSSSQLTQPQPQPIMRQTSQQQSHLAHWCNVVGRNNPLLAFVLVRHENHDNNGAAAAILNTSSCFSRIPINYGYNKVDNLFECTVNISGVDVVSARSTSRKKAREQAVVEAIAELPKHCFTLRVKKNMLAESVTLDQVANDLASRSLGSQDNPLSTNSVAGKMMKQMGWTGGGLGKKGEGITEPIRPSEVFGRQGLGLTETSNVKGAVTPAFRKRVRDIISNYASNARNVNLAFSNEFSKDQRAEIHKIARLCHLKSVSHGSGKTRCIVISRKIAAQDLLLRLLQEGSNDQYQLTPPTSYQP